MQDVEGIVWVSANEIVEGVTRRLARLYMSSNPKPRNGAMGFREKEPLPSIELAGAGRGLSRLKPLTKPARF
jgi:hypothetical protein